MAHSVFGVSQLASFGLFQTHTGFSWKPSSPLWLVPGLYLPARLRFDPTIRYLSFNSRFVGKPHFFTFSLANSWPIHCSMVSPLQRIAHGHCCVPPPQTLPCQGCLAQRAHLSPVPFPAGSTTNRFCLKLLLSSLSWIWYLLPLLQNPRTVTELCMTCMSVLFPLINLVCRR